MEHENVIQIKKIWEKRFLENFFHIILFSSVVVSYIIIDGATMISILILIIYLPIIMLKLFFPIRILIYLSVLQKGVIDSAILTLIENDNLFGGRAYLGGYTYRYIFHLKLSNGENIINKNYKVICVDINPKVLSLKKVDSNYVVPKDTIVPIMTYHGKIIVLQNDCGFYDLAHCNSPMINQFW